MSIYGYMMALPLQALADLPPDAYFLALDLLRTGDPKAKVIANMAQAQVSLPALSYPSI